MTIEDLQKGKSAELYVFRELIARGAHVYLPILDDGVDAVVKRKDGTYAEIQVKATQKEDQAGYFNVRDLQALGRPNYFVVCVDLNEGMAIEKGKPNIWILSADDFKTYGQSGTRGKQVWGYRLPIYERSRKHADQLRSDLLRHRFWAWDLLT